MSRTTRWLVLAMLVCGALPVEAKDLYVRAGAAGGDGTRDKPFADPDDALRSAVSGDVIHVAAGDKTPSKGGPGITRSDLLVINKVDLAPHVGASLDVMERDARRMRGTRPFVFSNLHTGEGLDAVAAFIEEKGGLAAR